MLFLLGEDLVLHVYDSPTDIPQAIEALDIDETVLAMFDEHGQRYAVEWIRPNECGRLLLLLNWCQNGVYRLRPDGVPDPAAARMTVDRAVALGHPGPFTSLAEVRTSIG